MPIAVLSLARILSLTCRIKPELTTLAHFPPEPPFAARLTCSWSRSDPAVGSDQIWCLPDHLGHASYLSGDLKFNSHLHILVSTGGLRDRFGHGRKVSPSISSVTAPTIAASNSLLLREAGCLVKRSAHASRHRMTQACLHMALHSCA